MNQQTANILRTIFLNVVFILILPVILSLKITDTWILILLYLPGYSLIEYSIDYIYYARRRTDLNSLKLLTYKSFLIITVVNLVLLVGTSVIISSFIQRFGTNVVIYNIIIWILFVSWLETIIEKKLMEEL